MSWFCVTSNFVVPGVVVSVLFPSSVSADLAHTEGLRPYHISMGAVYRIETSTNAQVAEPHLGLSLALARRLSVLDLSLEYQEIHRDESGNQMLSLGSKDREILAYVDYPIPVFSSQNFRTAVGLGSGVVLSSARTRFQNSVTESSSQADLLLKAGLSLKYVIGSFQVGLDGRLHACRATSERVMPEILLRFGSRF